MKSLETGMPMIPPGIDRDIHRVLSAVREEIEVRKGARGKNPQRFVSVDMLLAAGIISAEQHTALTNLPVS